MNFRMNTAIILAAAILCIGGTDLFCQTAIIAHRSHGGGMESFNANGGDKFGMPPHVIDSVVRITDTSALEFSNFGVDTIYKGSNRIDPSLDVDSLRRAFPGINFIGFDKNLNQSEYLPKPGRARDAASADLRDDAGRGTRMLLLALCAAVALPSLGYGIWRTEKRRTS